MSLCLYYKMPISHFHNIIRPVSQKRFKSSFNALSKPKLSSPQSTTASPGTPPPGNSLLSRTVSFPTLHNMTIRNFSFMEWKQVFLFLLPNSSSFHPCIYKDQFFFLFLKITDDISQPMLSQPNSIFIFSSP